MASTTTADAAPAPTSTSLPKISNPRLDELEESILKYKFEDRTLLMEALEAPGTKLSSETERLGNKRLAFLGKRVLQTVILEKWYFDGSNLGGSTEISLAFICP